MPCRWEGPDGAEKGVQSTIQGSFKVWLLPQLERQHRNRRVITKIKYGLATGAVQVSFASCQTRWHNHPSGPGGSSSPFRNLEEREQWAQATARDPRIKPDRTRNGTGGRGPPNQLCGPQSQLPPRLSLSFPPRGNSSRTQQLGKGQVFAPNCSFTLRSLGRMLGNQYVWVMTILVTVLFIVLHQLINSYH